MSVKVDTGIPYGNACDISVVEKGDVTEVSFAADPHGGPECLWFCFRLIRNSPATKSDGKIKLILKHFHNMLGWHEACNIRPVLKHAGGDWLRLGPGILEKLPDGRCRVVWIINAPEPSADMAFCYPYGRPEIEDLLQDTSGYWRADTIGISQNSRPLVRVSNSPGEVGSKRPGLYLIARQHSGETPGSWVMDGFLRYIASAGEDALLVWAVPLSNIDGIERGDYGKDNFPYDLNRAWGSPPMRHEVLVFQRDMQRWKERCRPVFGIDFHAPGACESEGIYCFVPDPEGYPGHHRATLRWTEIFAHALTPEYASLGDNGKSFARVARYSSRWETPGFSSYCYNTVGICGIGLETPYAMAGDTIFTREHYREAGSRIAACIVRELNV